MVARRRADADLGIHRLAVATPAGRPDLVYDHRRHPLESVRAVTADSGRGYRRVVPSPAPVAIAEIYAVKTLINAGALVICAGGGGVPVVRDEAGDLHGVSAVIDKDLGAALLAQKLDADRLLILTDVEQVYINFRKPDQQALSRVNLKEVKRYIQEGQFTSGSMGPKVQAAVAFIEAGGKQAIITHLNSVVKALAGETGTSIEL